MLCVISNQYLTTVHRLLALAEHSRDAARLAWLLPTKISRHFARALASYGALLQPPSSALLQASNSCSASALTILIIIPIAYQSSKLIALSIICSATGIVDFVRFATSSPVDPYDRRRRPSPHQLEPSHLAIYPIHSSRPVTLYCSCHIGLAAHQSQSAP